jgi:hypothetical protein
VNLDRESVDAEDFAIATLKILNATADRGQLGRSDEAKIAGIKKNCQPAIAIIRKAHHPPGAGRPGGRRQGKIGRSGADQEALLHRDSPFLAQDSATGVQAHISRAAGGNQWN